MTTEIFDLDALDAEANKEPFQFRFDGKVYTCADDIAVEVIQSIEANDILGAFELIVGSDQWASLVAANKTFGVERMGKTLNAYAKHLGIELPNS